MRYAKAKYCGSCTYFHESRKDAADTYCTNLLLLCEGWTGWGLVFRNALRAGQKEGWICPGYEEKVNV